MSLNIWLRSRWINQNYIVSHFNWYDYSDKNYLITTTRAWRIIQFWILFFNIKFFVSFLLHWFMSKFGLSYVTFDLGFDRIKCSADFKIWPFLSLEQPTPFCNTYSKRNKNNGWMNVNMLWMNVCPCALCEFRFLSSYDLFNMIPW